MEDSITCQGCGNDHTRVALEGQELQPSPNYICDSCVERHNDKTGATKAEREARIAEVNAPEVEPVATLVEDAE